MNKYKNLTIGIILGILFLTCYNLTGFIKSCKDIRNDTLRLHVIANSDTNEDQSIKLAVRDALLESGQKLFDGTTTPENAAKKIKSEKTNLEKIANDTLKECGADYNAEVLLTTEYFDTRTYNDEITLPAGKYLALKIVLGDGDGKNWWCVMFPSLCLPAAEKTNSEALATVYSENEKLIVSNGKKFKLKFKVIEYLEKIKHNVDIHIKG